MKIHLHQVPPQGLHLAGEEDCAINELAGQGVHCVGPMRYELDVGVSGGALWANGTIAQRVELRCVACLERFDHDINVPEFALHTPLPGPEVIDITPFMREDILLNLPAYPRCDQHGGKNCAGANAAVPQSSDDSATTIVKRKQDWAELDKLKIEKN